MISRPRLNGWQRLWVVVAVLWLVVVATFTAIIWPVFETTWHRDYFISRMPEESRRHIVASYDSEWSAREGKHSGYIKATAPNGAVLIIRGEQDARIAAVRKKYPQYDDLSDAQLVAALKTKFPEFANLVPDSFVPDAVLQRTMDAYHNVVNAELRRARWATFTYAVLGWFVPSAAVYAVGWSVAWVRRGFSPPPNHMET